jgi:hypothetical protein
VKALRVLRVPLTTYVSCRHVPVAMYVVAEETIWTDTVAKSASTMSKSDGIP